MNTILILGTNDRATATAVRLFKAGFAVLVCGLENAQNLYSHRNISTILMAGKREVEQVKFRTYADWLYHEENAQKKVKDFVSFCIHNREIPALTIAEALTVAQNVELGVICEAPVFKATTEWGISELINAAGQESTQARYQIAINGVHTGKVLYTTTAIPNIISNEEGVIYAPSAGLFIANRMAGETVKENENIGNVDTHNLKSPQSGVVAGVEKNGKYVEKGQPIFKIVAEYKHEKYIQIPWKAWAIAGGVLEAVLYHKNITK